MISQEQLLAKETVPPTRSYCLWDTKRENDVSTTRGEINFKMWFFDDTTISNSLIQVLAYMKKTCQEHLDRFIAEQKQSIEFTIGITYQVKTLIKPCFYNLCVSNKMIQPEISFLQKDTDTNSTTTTTTATMTHFDRDYESAATNLKKNFFQQLSHTEISGYTYTNLKIVSYTLEYKTLNINNRFHISPNGAGGKKHSLLMATMF